MTNNGNMNHDHNAESVSQPECVCLWLKVGRRNRPHQDDWKEKQGSWQHRPGLVPLLQQFALWGHNTEASLEWTCPPPKLQLDKQTKQCLGQQRHNKPNITNQTT